MNAPIPSPNLLDECTPSHPLYQTPLQGIMSRDDPKIDNTLQMTLYSY